MKSRIKLSGLIALSWLSLSSAAWAAEPDKTDGGLPLDYLRDFSYIFERIKNDYVESVQDKQLMENAIRGLLSGLDPHSTYLSPDEYKELKIGTSGEFGGLGIQVEMEDGLVKVISPIDDTPAYHAGIKTGDLIIKLDDKPVKGLSLNEAVNLMRGKPGSKIVLTIMRQGENSPRTFTLERSIIKVKSVKQNLLEKDYGYVRITNFQSNTAENLHDSLVQLQKDNKSALKGLILDLRNNPGGVLNAANDVVDEFIESGLVVYTKGRAENSYFEYRAKPGDTLKGAPVVVLINSGSASASEIVAGALQDHKRAIIMGSKSFGKGSVQTIQELPNGGAVKLTTARYFTPNGRSIQAEGIEPDIELQNLALQEKPATVDLSVKEADLSGHLANPNESTKPDTAQKTEKTKIQDYPVNEALNLLKGLNLYNKPPAAAPAGAKT
jgi:carboxyl-terminal processing protease